jgi:hypothetical protein
VRVISLVALCVLRIGVAHATPTPPIPADVHLPSGTRTVNGELVAARGLRETTDAIAKDLDKRGIAVKQIGPYRVRGVELTRFVSLTASTSWLAIHVIRIGGRTTITVIARPLRP